MENVSVALNLEEGDDEAASMLVPRFYIPIEKLVYEKPGSIYAVYERINGACPTGIFFMIIVANVFQLNFRSRSTFMFEIAILKVVWWMIILIRICINQNL